MRETRAYWLYHLKPAMANFRNVVKDDGSGIVPSSGELDRAIESLKDALEEFSEFYGSEE
jgi:hypothetical protein